jgi:ABC-type uncharacterized transport system substrate-binding protein
MILRHKTASKPTRLSSLLITALLLMTTFIPPASAHPHVFVDYGITFVFNQQGLAGITVEWAFDEMFTQMLVEESDLNRDQHFDSREIAKIKAGAFDNLASHAYFTHILVNNQPYQVSEISNFDVTLEDGQAHYSFFIPCQVRAGNIPQKVSLTLYDPTYYSDLSLASDGIDYRGPIDHFSLHHEETLAQDAGFPQAPLLPDGIILEFQIK